MQRSLASERLCSAVRWGGGCDGGSALLPRGRLLQKKSCATSRRTGGGRGSELVLSAEGRNSTCRVLDTATSTHTAGLPVPPLLRDRGAQKPASQNRDAGSGRPGDARLPSMQGDRARSATACLASLALLFACSLWHLMQHFSAALAKATPAPRCYTNCATKVPARARRTHFNGQTSEYQVLLTCAFEP